MLKKKQSTHTELFANVKTANYRFKIVPILHGEQQKKMELKNLKLVFHLSVSQMTIHVIKLIPFHQNNNDEQKQTKNGDPHAIRRQTIRYGETHVISFVLTRQKPKVSK